MYSLYKIGNISVNDKKKFLMHRPKIFHSRKVYFWTWSFLKKIFSFFLKRRFEKCWTKTLKTEMNQTTTTTKAEMLIKIPSQERNFFWEIKIFEIKIAPKRIDRSFSIQFNEEEEAKNRFCIDDATSSKTSFPLKCKKSIFEMITFLITEFI